MSLLNCFTSSRMENLVFRLHYKWTVLLLLSFSLGIGLRFLVGGPITCFGRGDIHVPTSILESSCYIQGTFSSSAAWNMSVGIEISYPGLDKGFSRGYVVYHSYYKWVGYLFVIQAIFFYLPAYVWKSLEGGRMRAIIRRLGLEDPLSSDGDDYKKVHMLVDKMYNNLGNRRNLINFVGYTAAEVMNFVNVIFQVGVTNKLLNGQFISYGWKIMSFDGWEQEVHDNPELRVFPDQAKCTFNKYGSSGVVQMHSIRCILNNNYVYSKFFFFLWFWFTFLVTVSLLTIVYRISLIFLPKLRVFSQSPHREDHRLEAIVSKLSLGDWFVFHHLSKHLDSSHFKELVNGLYSRIVNTESFQLKSCED